MEVFDDKRSREETTDFYCFLRVCNFIQSSKSFTVDDNEIFDIYRILKSLKRQIEQPKSDSYIEIVQLHSFIVSLSYTNEAMKP